MFVDMWQVVVWNIYYWYESVFKTVSKKEPKPQSEPEATVWWNNVVPNAIPTSKINPKSLSNVRVIWSSCLQSRGIQILELYVGPGRSPSSENNLFVVCLPRRKGSAYFLKLWNCPFHKMCLLINMKFLPCCNEVLASGYVNYNYFPPNTYVSDDSCRITSDSRCRIRRKSASNV